VTPGDLAAPDLASPADLASAADLASPTDLAVPLELDLAVTVPPDQATPPDVAVAVDAALACDPSQMPDDSVGYFVSTSGANVDGGGTDAGADGTRANPFRSIGYALAAARDTGRSRVFVDVGIYPETLVFVDSNPGITVEGGWNVTGSTWTRDCEPGARALTVVASNDAVAVTATGITHQSGLASLTVQTKQVGSSPADGVGESLIGILVSGDGSRFKLNDVYVRAGSAGAGGPATGGTAGTTRTCDGLTTCSTGVGGTSASAGAAAAAGTFQPTGYLPASGSVGVAGTDGENGTMGGAGNSETCLTSCYKSSTGSCTSTTGTVSSQPGTCGCGGTGGQPGSPGRSGGTSAALWISGSGTLVSVDKSVLRAENGGAGGAGGAGGLGGSGSAGAMGTTQCCNLTCYDVPFGCLTFCGPPPIWGGTAGGFGGAGGAGATGGGGAGGSSIAVVTFVGASTVLDSSTILQVGVLGSGAGGAPNGFTALQYTP
jgi:hypothetical protein